MVLSAGSGNVYVCIFGFKDTSTSKVIGARVKLFFMIMMANDMGPRFSPTFLLQLRKKPGKKSDQEN